MGLAEYKKKRRFNQTPEPGPRERTSEFGHIFVAQKPRATEAINEAQRRVRQRRRRHNGDSALLSVHETHARGNRRRRRRRCKESCYRRPKKTSAPHRHKTT